MFDPLPADLAAAVGSALSRLGDSARLHYCHDVQSTNDTLLSLSLAGEPEGTAVLADLQRAGRGRRGRQWFSPPGAGVYLSVLMRTRAVTGPLSMVTLAAGVAVAQATTATSGLPVELKWPNDVVIGRPWRKLGGVLCETAGVGSQIDAVIVGVGVNLRSASYPREIAGRATSIETELGRPVDRAPLVVELLVRIGAMMRALHAGQDERIRQEWRQLAQAGLGGAPVRWHDQNRLKRGRARDIDVDGALLVETGGQVERLVSGEVTWELLSGD